MIMRHCKLDMSGNRYDFAVRVIRCFVLMILVAA